MVPAGDMAITGFLVVVHQEKTAFIVAALLIQHRLSSSVTVRKSTLSSYRPARQTRCWRNSTLSMNGTARFTSAITTAQTSSLQMVTWTACLLSPGLKINGSTGKELAESHRQEASNTFVKPVRHYTPELLSRATAAPSIGPIKSLPRSAINGNREPVSAISARATAW